MDQLEPAPPGGVSNTSQLLSADLPNEGDGFRVPGVDDVRNLAEIAPGRLLEGGEGGLGVLP